MTKKASSLFDDMLAQNRARFDEMVNPSLPEMPSPPAAPTIRTLPQSGPSGPVSHKRPEPPAKAPISATAAGGLRFTFRPH